MKARIIVLIVLFLCQWYISEGQVPQGFNYQAIARDGSDNLIVNTTLQVRISVMADSSGTNVLWQELHTGVLTNSLGLFKIVIGRGSKTGGTVASFSNINWSVTPIFIKTEIDYLGWKDMGTTRLWSVPYSQYSAKSADGFSGNYNDLYNKPLLFDGTWSSLTGKPVFATVATSGSYTDLLNKPTILNSQWVTSGTSIYYNAGNVGIGVPAPVRKLEVNGEAAIGTNYYQNGGIELGQGATGNRYAIIDFHGDDTYSDYALRIIRYNNGPDAGSSIAHRGLGELNLATSEAAPIKFYTSGAARMIINPTGSVGIGTVSPGFILDVAGRSRIQSGGGDAGIWYMNSGNTANRAFIGMMASDHVGFYGAGGANWGMVMNVNNGNVGIGNTAPTSKVIIQPPTTWDDNLPLFEVKNKSGVTVFAVYNNGIRAFVQTNSGKAVKGGFAIGGFDPTKAGNVPLMSLSPDSIRFYIDNASTKATKGGFAIGSFNVGKAPNQDFMYVTPQNSGNGQYNTFLGYQAGLSSGSLGTFNVFIGEEAGRMNVNGTNNTLVGYKAGYSNTYSWNTCIGYMAGYSNIAPSNTFVGQESGYSNTTGTINTFLGKYSGRNTVDGSGNTFLGNGAGCYNISGVSNTCIGQNSGVNIKGSYNVTLGSLASPLNNSGSNNVVLGYSAGYQNTAGTGNIFIGYKAAYNELGSNLLYIDNSTTASPLIWGDFANNRVVINGSSADNILNFTFYANGTAGGDYGWNVASDRRLKKNIETIDNPIEKVMDLRGVLFNWNDPTKSAKQQMGFIAQEAEEIIPQVVNKSNGYYSMDYAPVTALLVEGMKQQQKTIITQNEKIARLEKLVEEMKSAMDRSGIK